MNQAEDWPRQWTAQIGAAVARHRKRAGLSAAQLSERCAEHGFPIPRNTIANLENGRKESAPVHEVVVLAAALGVAPADLLFPAALSETVAILPGGPARPTVEAAAWFVGVMGDYRAEIEYYLEHEARVQSLGRSEQDDQGAAIAEKLSRLRETMDARGLRLPDLPADVQWWFEPDAQGIPNYRMGESYSILGRGSDG